MRAGPTRRRSGVTSSTASPPTTCARSHGRTRQSCSSTRCRWRCRTTPRRSDRSPLDFRRARRSCQGAAMTDAATDTAIDPTAPLTGVRVLDLTRMFPGAYCTSLLADLGADVLKIEAPGFGDGLRFMGEDFPASHVAVNRGKRSMTLNLKSPRAGEILRRLVRDADVL